MLSRLQFPLIAAFFVVMNFLLWRSEFSGRTNLGSPMPAEAVWQRILTAPDDSALEITRGGVDVGYCRWVPNVGEQQATGRTLPEDYEPESLVQKLSGYTIDLEGNILLEKARVRFSLNLVCGTNNTWRTLSLNLAHRPDRVEIRASAVDRTLQFRLVAGDQEINRTFTFDELRDPAKLAAGFGHPMLPALLGPWGFTAPSTTNPLGLAAHVDWQARSDWLAFGRSRMRVYRLEARLFDRHRIVVITSRVGEILRVELPGNILLHNDALLAPPP